MKRTPAEDTHFRLLETWRGAMDLVGPGPLEPHFQDAAGAVAGLEAEGRWVDLGSGAGFPGIALAARHPSAEVWLVESRRKRAVFLERVLAEVDLPGARVVHGRSESLDDGLFDGVISRAYRQPAAYLADAGRVLRAGGRAVLLTGDKEAEVPEGFTWLASTRYRVGRGWRRRHVLQKDVAT